MLNEPHAHTYTLTHTYTGVKLICILVIQADTHYVESSNHFYDKLFFFYFSSKNVFIITLALNTYLTAFSENYFLNYIFRPFLVVFCKCLKILFLSQSKDECYLKQFTMHVSIFCLLNYLLIYLDLIKSQCTLISFNQKFVGL